MALPTILPLLARDTLLGQRKLWNPCKAASSLRLRKRLSLAQAVSGLRAAQLATLDYLHSLNLVWTRIVVEPEVVAGGSCTCDCGNIARGDLPEVFPGSCVDDVPVQIPNTLRLELLPSCQNVVPLGFAKLLDVHLGKPLLQEVVQASELAFRQRVDHIGFSGFHTLARGPPGAHDVDPLPVLRKPETAAVHHSPAHSIGPLLRPRKPTFLELLQKFVEVLPVLLIPDARHILQHKSTRLHAADVVHHSL